MRWVLPAMAPLLLCGCPTPLPGESVGAFEVQGRLERNECGQQAVPARDPVEFPVEIRVDDGRAIWRRPDAPHISGTVSEGVYEFEAQSRHDVIEGDPMQGQPGCVLIQNELVTARVIGGAMGGDASTPGDAGAPDGDGSAPQAPDAELEGTHLVELTPASGSDCTSALAAAGGPFLELPCALEYALSGTEREPF